MTFLSNNTNLLPNEFFDEVSSKKICFQLEEAVGGNPWVAQRVIKIFETKGMEEVQNYLGFSLPEEAVAELTA